MFVVSQLLLIDGSHPGNVVLNMASSMETQRQKRRVIRVGWEVCKWLVLLGILYWIAYRVPQRDWDILISQPKDYGYLLGAFGLVFVSNVVTFWRWKQLLDALEVRFSIWEVIRIGFLGVALSLVSVGSVGGDVFKALAAVNRSRDRKTEVVTSVLVDRAIGLLGLVLVAAIALSISSKLSVQMVGIRTGAWVLGLVGLGGLTAICLFGRAIPTHWVGRLPLVGGVLQRVLESCLIFQEHRGLAFRMVVSSLLVHVLATLACWFVSMGLYVRSAVEVVPTFLEHLQAIPPALAAATLPLTPGGLGMQELWIDGLFRQLEGVSSEYSGLVMATMYRVILILIAGVGGMIYLSSGRVKA